MDIQFNEDTYKHILEEVIPFQKFLNLKVQMLRDGYCKMHVPFQEVLVGDPRIKRWHGGIIATILDAVGGGAGFTLMKNQNDKISTIDIRVDYLRSSKPLDIYAEGFLIRKGSNTIHCKMRAYHLIDDQEEIIAEGIAVLDIKIGGKNF